MADASAGAPLPLSRYNAKRDFSVTSEPAGTRSKAKKPSKTLVFVVQKHWASRLHYDFRLELDGVMLSWAVPKGPSLTRPRRGWRSTSTTKTSPLGGRALGKGTTRTLD